MIAWRSFVPVILVTVVASSGTAISQEASARSRDNTATAIATAATSVPPGYLIGANDVLSIVFWRDKDMSAEVTVRPDGKISLPLLNDVDAAGLTPEGLRAALTNAAARFIEEPTISVVVKEIHSRSVFITGNVGKPGTYPLGHDMTVLQLIATAGGLAEYADSKNISVIGTENGQPYYHKFNYNDVIKQARPGQNIRLKPGDTVVVP